MKEGGVMRLLAMAYLRIMGLSNYMVIIKVTILTITYNPN